MRDKRGVSHQLTWHTIIREASQMSLPDSRQAAGYFSEWLRYLTGEFIRSSNIIGGLILDTNADNTNAGG